MKCPKCSGLITRVDSTEKGHKLCGRLRSMSVLEDMVSEWGEAVVFRRRVCASCSHRFLTIEFPQDAD